MKYLLKLYIMTEDELQKRVIHNIRSLRKAIPLSQEKLADKADVSRQTMSDIEGGRRFLSKSSLVKVANALGVDVYELFLPTKNEITELSGVYNVAMLKAADELRQGLNDIIDKIQKQCKA